MCVARPNLCGWWDTGSVRARGGFTIIEVMLTIGILALIAGLIAPTFTSWRREAAFDAAKTRVADAISRCAGLSQRDGVARVLVAEVWANGATRLIVQQLKAATGTSGANEVNGEESVPVGTVLAELATGLSLVVGEASEGKSKGTGVSESGEGPVQLALCVAMPDGMIKRAVGAIRLTQSDGTVTVTATMGAGASGSAPVSQATVGLLRSSVMSIDEFTGRVSWRDEEIKPEGTGTPERKSGGESDERGAS